MSFFKTNEQQESNKTNETNDKLEETNNKLRRANEILHLTDSLKTIVFVYSAPKVGSTSLVTSLRLFGSSMLSIIHIHDEEMLHVLANIDGITVLQLIQYNQSLGRKVIVMNSYRTPIERKISAYFEKIGSFHFNVLDDQINQYDIQLLIRRFHHLFPHLDSSDHFLTKYGLTSLDLEWAKEKKENKEKEETSPFIRQVEKEGVHYVTLRLSDASKWHTVLSDLFGFPIQMVRDYQSEDKPIKNAFRLFQQYYRIPLAHLSETMACPTFAYYYSLEERQAYEQQWLAKSTTDVVTSFSTDEYRLYQRISMENAHLECVQSEHYADEGCVCKACCYKRQQMVRILLSSSFSSSSSVNPPVSNVPVIKVKHDEAKAEWLQYKQQQRQQRQLLQQCGKQQKEKTVQMKLL